MVLMVASWSSKPQVSVRTRLFAPKKDIMIKPNLYKRNHIKCFSGYSSQFGSITGKKGDITSWTSNYNYTSSSGLFDYMISWIK